MSALALTQHERRLRYVSISKVSWGIWILKLHSVLNVNLSPTCRNVLVMNGRNSCVWCSRNFFKAALIICQCGPHFAGLVTSLTFNNGQPLPAKDDNSANKNKLIINNHGSRGSYSKETLLVYARSAVQWKVMIWTAGRTWNDDLVFITVLNPTYSKCGIHAMNISHCVNKSSDC